MADQQTKPDPQRDKGLSVEQRPVPSQAEGDLETVEEDLKLQEKKPKQ